MDMADTSLAARRYHFRDIPRASEGVLVTSDILLQNVVTIFFKELTADRK